MVDSSNIHNLDTNVQHPGEAPIVWSSSKRLWVSLILLFHLFAVVLAPLAVVEPRPQIAFETQTLLRPYSESLFLLHGYRFFAPEPGPSHIVRYVVGRDDGSEIEGQFPDGSSYFPRLRYHRWFMLSESLFQHVSGTLDPTQLAEWHAGVVAEIENLLKTDPRAAELLENQLKRELAQHEGILELRDKLVSSIGKVLLKEHEGQWIEMKLLTRVIPPPDDIAKGLKIDNERYIPEELGVPLGRLEKGQEELEQIAPLEANQGNQSDRSSSPERDKTGGGP